MSKSTLNKSKSCESDSQATPKCLDFPRFGVLELQGEVMFIKLANAIYDPDKLNVFVIVKHKHGQFGFRCFSAKAIHRKIQNIIK